MILKAAVSNDTMLFSKCMDHLTPRRSCRFSNYFGCDCCSSASFPFCCTCFPLLAVSAALSPPASNLGCLSPVPNGYTPFMISCGHGSPLGCSTCHDSSLCLNSTWDGFFSTSTTSADSLSQSSPQPPLPTSQPLSFESYASS